MWQANIEYAALASGQNQVPEKPWNKLKMAA
jgi:hypothetical protein